MTCLLHALDLLDYFYNIVKRQYLANYAATMKINVPEKYADLYLKALVERKGMLESKIQDFKQEIEEIDTHISNLTSLPIFSDSGSFNKVQWETKSYRAEWAWTKKISYFIDFKGTLITSGDVVNFLLEKEPQLDKRKIRSSVSAALSNKIKQRLYSKFNDPVTNTTYYGPTEWFGIEGKPQVGYLPQELKERLINNPE